MEHPQAFLITVKHWKHHCIIYAARSRGHAKTGTWYELLEQNFKPPLRFTDIQARRARQFDTEAKKYAGLRGPVCIGWREGGESWGVGGEKLIGIDTED